MEDKVEVSLVYKDGDDLKIEKVIAEKVGAIYKIKSVPAFSNNIAYNDIICV